MNPILKKLEGGDLRSIGNADEVAVEAEKDPSILKILLSEGIFSQDPVVRARSADAAEKVGRKKPECIQPFKMLILNKASKINQKEVRWHVAQMLSCLTLNNSERRKAEELLFTWVDSDDKSSIVKVFSLQALADLATQDKEIVERLHAKLEETLRTGSPALKSRSRKLTKQLSD